MLTFSPSPNQRLFNLVNLFLQHLAQQGPECWSPAALCFLMRTLGEQRRKPDDVLRLCASLAGWRSWTTSWTTSLLHSNEAWLTDSFRIRRSALQRTQLVSVQPSAAAAPCYATAAERECLSVAMVVFISHRRQKNDGRICLSVF